MKTLYFKVDQLHRFHPCYQSINNHLVLFFPSSSLCSINFGPSLHVWSLPWFIFFPTALLSLIFVSVTFPSLALLAALPLTPIFMFTCAPSPLWLQCPLHTRPGLGPTLAQPVPPCAWALLSPSGVRKSLLLVSAGKLVYPPPNPAFITLPK